MFSLLQGLTILHNLDKDVTNSILRGIHQDLKPTNIFVFQAHTGKLGYKYRFKIGDFGLSSIRRRKAIHPDNKGTKMYGAPELTTSVLDLQDLDFGATNKVDIWSMGCIYYEMLVWITCGQRGRDEFLSMRVNEGGSEAAFHNHTEDLSALDDMLKLLLSRRRIFDHLTEPIAERIQCSMLCFEPKDRLAARFLLTEFKKVLEKAKSVEKGAVSAETPVSGSGFQYEQQFQGRHDHPRTPQPRSADNSRVSSLRSSALGYHPDTASIQTPQDSFGITMTSDLNSREATHARQSAPGRARGQAPHLTLQTTGPWQEMTTFETQLPPTRTVTRHETNVSPSTNRHNPGNRTRPSPGNHRVSAPAGTSDRSPRQSKHLALRPFSTDPAGSAGSSGQSLVANSGQFPDGGKWPDDPRVWDILRYKKEKKAKLLPDDFKLPGQEIALDYQGGREQVRLHACVYFVVSSLTGRRSLYLMTPKA
ncbi:kinase-like domain-containing protein [Apiosordaria backusii]|uniref:non-specific serine/threonine protein kinase n=1 Tax=Apiosordaria backusii TaxID=314023 RepID=A0AA40DZG9_9PEZI|nr:kinase-like domain-containing protein [Apiosordaria backusii]